MGYEITLDQILDSISFSSSREFSDVVNQICDELSVLYAEELREQSNFWLGYTDDYKWEQLELFVYSVVDLDISNPSSVKIYSILWNIPVSKAKRAMLDLEKEINRIV